MSTYILNKFFNGQWDKLVHFLLCFAGVLTFALFMDIKIAAGLTIAGSTIKEFFIDGKDYDLKDQMMNVLGATVASGVYLLSTIF